MAIIKCKMCGGDLELIPGQSVAECEYCGSRQTVPAADNDKKMTLFGRANRLRAACEFDKAAGIYETIVADFPEEAEAYWGLVLCKYGIEYVDDPATGKKIPTCHRSSFDSVMEDSDFEQALENADALARRQYREEAKQIEEIRKGIISVSANEQPYDIFICYKETDENGQRTLDSVLAQDIYDALTAKKYRVFFSRITLEDKLGMEYEPYIFAALNSAKIMLAVGTDYEYYNAVWVKNEWSRYLKLMAQDKGRHLIPCYKGIDAYDMPKEFAKLQAQDLGKVGAMQDLLRGIEKILPKNQPVTAQGQVIASGNATADSLLKRAAMFLEDEDWTSADEQFEKVLDIDPENAQAYLGKLLAELKVKKQEFLKEQAEPFDGSDNYKKAVRFADGELKITLVNCIDYIHSRNEKAHLHDFYENAKNAMSKARTERAYKKAGRLFESISEYQDAEVLAQKCFEQAMHITKRSKKIAMIATPIMLLIVIFAIMLNFVIIPNSKYNDAVALMNNGNIVEAYEILCALDGYKDSREKANSILGEYITEKVKNEKVGNYITLGTYEQDNNKSNGKEPIEWMILEKTEEKALLVSRYALDCQPYGPKTTKKVTWETSSLREWLNNNFINTAFSAREQTVISTAITYTDGETTQDKIFLLSIEEANKYFPSDNAKKCKPTAYATARGTYVNDDNGNCWWWLRSSNYNKSSAVYSGQTMASYVISNGKIYEAGAPGDSDDCAVRPALWINLGS